VTVAGSSLERISRLILKVLDEVGQLALLVAAMGRNVLSRLGVPPPLQADGGRHKSIPVVLITGLSTGMVLALQSYNGFQRFRAESLVGTVVALSMTRELGPVLTGLMVAGRAGAAMAAELGTMRVTEQIDALASMGVNPVKYLVFPRFVAGVMMLPILTVLADWIGIVGGYFVSVKLLDVNSTVYIRRTLDYLEVNDVYGGLLKAVIFGGIISLISCHRGFTAGGGAEGVGQATTGAVVTSCVLILISDYFLTALLY
jgi:phospholipid/cholesterol/gamma-HCH transport system permease protein